jgi:hypothetical protein
MKLTPVTRMLFFAALKKEISLYDLSQSSNYFGDVQFMELHILINVLPHAPLATLAGFPIW